MGKDAEVLVKRVHECMDGHGLVQDHPGNVTGNGLCFTGEAAITLIQNGVASDVLVFRAMEDGILSCALAFGFYTRHPEKFSNDQIGPDDHVGLGSFSAIWNATLAEDWIDFGERGWTLKDGKTRWDYYYPNELQYRDEFGWRAYHGKFLAMRCHMEWAARKEPSIGKKLAWAFSVITAKSKPGCEHDEWRLSWQLVSIYFFVNKRNWYCDLAAKKFRKNLYARFPGGIKECFGDYYKDPSHFQANYARDDWFSDEYKKEVTHL